MKLKKYWELYISFFRIGILTFGGGMAMLPMLTKEIIEKRKWATEDQVLDYFAIGQCTPGIIAVNTATFIGDKEAGAPGAFFATFGVVSPSILIITLIASVLRVFMDNPYVIHALSGIRIAVCALTLNSVIKLVKKAVIDTRTLILYIVVFVLAYFSPVPTAALVVLAGAAGIFLKLKEVRAA